MYQAKAIKYVLSREAMNFKSQNLANAIALDNKGDIELLENSENSKLDLNEIVESEVIENETA